ncbi:hypothetical protein KI387_030921, partial [Taxus chinensis]
TFGKSGRVRREKLKWPRVEKNRLSLASCGLGQPGQKYAWDANRSICRRTIHFKRFGDICPKQSETVGMKVREGRVGHEK